MAEKRVQRRLAAILAADVAGYSRLMGEDEEGTLAALTSHLSELIEPCIAEYRGRVVKTTGDGLLAEFASVVDAVKGAIALQEGMVDRNTDTPEERRIVFRIGVNLGDVIVQDDDVYGDGVNVAARLEGFAEPGGVVVSGKVHEEVRTKVDFGFDDLGPQEVKNIAEPVHAYRIRLQSDATTTSDGSLTLPDKPSIAVLPFANMSGDPEQEYFADGMAEDIITALSRFHWFFVIARNSSFSYKGRSVDVRQIGRELGVRYVLEGSVRKSSNRLRITAQLIEAETGNHLWAERYDGELADAFDLQDRITEGVVGAVEPSVRRAEIERARHKRPDSLDAYDLYLRALPHAWVNTPQEADKALELLDEALEIDPNYAAARAMAGWCRGQRSRLGGEIGAENWSVSVEHAQKLIASGTDDAVALAFAGFQLVLDCQYDAGLDAAARGVELNPNSAVVLQRSAFVNAIAGQYEKAIDQAQRSIRLSPLDPMRYTSESALVVANIHGGMFAEALEAAQRAIKYNPGFDVGRTWLVASYVLLDRLAEAEEEVRRLLEINPNFRIKTQRFLIELGDEDPINAALRKAGLPE